MGHIEYPSLNMEQHSVQGGVPSQCPTGAPTQLLVVYCILPPELLLGAPYTLQLLGSPQFGAGYTSESAMATTCLVHSSMSEQSVQPKS